jgi:hypothetical protein
MLVRGRQPLSNLVNGIPPYATINRSVRRPPGSTLTAIRRVAEILRTAAECVISTDRAMAFYLSGSHLFGSRAPYPDVGCAQKA